MTHLKIIIFLFTVLIVLGCSQAKEHSISTMIVEETLDEILSLNADRLVLNISSPGGKGGPSLEIAEFLSQKHVTINVFDICNSACSQLFLPVADKVHFINNPFIGFHHSFATEAEYYMKYGQDIEPCVDMTEAYNREKALLKKHNISLTFWKEIDKRLKPRDYKYIPYFNDDCKGYEYTFEHSMWFPTSDQLRDLFGLEFKGTVCADNYTACTRRIQAMTPTGTSGSIVIGDKVYAYGQ